MNKYIKQAEDAILFAAIDGDLDRDKMYFRNGILINQASLIAKIAILIEQEAIREQSRIIDKISNMKLDISSDAIINGRVEIMHHIAKRLKEKI